MNFHLRYAEATCVDVCLIGVGGFGRSLFAQSANIPLLNCRVLIDIDATDIVATLRTLGLDDADFAVCRSSADASKAWDTGKIVISEGLQQVVHLPFSVVVEATGHPEAGAEFARLSIENGKHVALVSKEVDSVAGAGLAHLAAQNNVVVTPVDGDQPSLLIGLISWAEVLGLDIISAGKSSEYDFVFDAETNNLSCNGVAVSLPQMAGLMQVDGRSMAELTQLRSQAARAFLQRAVPDLCEMSIVANATGFKFDRTDLHAPIARIGEVPDMFNTVNSGGLFSQTGVLDVFHCLRRPDEISLAGGVFIVVRCADPETWEMLAQKGHIVNANRSAAMITIPRHLLGLEAATSILDMALLGQSSGGAIAKHDVELVATASADLAKGHVLAMGGHHHTIEHIEARVLTAGPLTPEAPAPFYLAANKTLARNVAAGAIIRMQDLVINADSELWKLRQFQDQSLCAPEPKASA